ncbi:helix-turn-helix transcriptional regulator [Halobacteriovorax sp. RZ-3]|uniref:helix-turn-helix domain-containing protein n=1 Tax=Halobacteriovorax sp. RZ-3 TaxID=3157720 RepID=UPI003723045E
MLSDVLRSLIEKHNISLTKLSKLTDVPQSNISGWLEGTNPNLKQLKQVANYFDVTVDYLITGEEIHPVAEILNNGCEILNGKYQIIINKLD